MAHPTLDDLMVASVPELKDLLRTMLPDSCQLHSDWDPGEGLFNVLVRRIGENGIVLWSQSGIDERILLLDLAGWLWFDRLPQPPPGSPWTLRNNRAAPARRPIGLPHLETSMPDPEDLDPEEVQTVYKREGK